jgi:hypothetical protein
MINEARAEDLGWRFGDIRYLVMKAATQEQVSQCV